jgi:hypothetical protein
MQQKETPTTKHSSPSPWNHPTELAQTISCDNIANSRPENLEASFEFPYFAALSRRSNSSTSRFKPFGRRLPNLAK